MNESKPKPAPELLGLIAEFETPEELVAAAARVREAGFTKWDAHSPFPVHGLDEAMGIKTSPLQYITIGAGATGLAAGLAMQVWMNEINYSYLLGGKPHFSIPAYIPISFETTILFAAIATFAGMLALNGLPKFFHAVFTSKRFLRATADRFFISIEAEDPKFDSEQTAAFLESLGGAGVERLEE